MERITSHQVVDLMEAYNAVHAPQINEEQVWEEVESWVNSLLEEGYDLSEYTWEEMYEAYLNEERRDPRGRVASGPMSVYGGRGTPSPDPEGDDNISRMDRAQRRVKRTQPRAKGMAADSLFTRYSARQKEMEHGDQPSPSDRTAKGHPHSPARGGRKGRGANTDRGKGNAAKRRMSEDFDLFDTILEYLVAEGYADTNESALVIMANMSEDWRESICEAAADQSDKQIDKGVRTTYKAKGVLANQASRGLNRLPSNEREGKKKRMNKRLETRRDDLFGERNKREDESRAEIKKKYGL
jgi:hypothetical protein